MIKWTFEDDCLAPQGRIKIEYRGKNPFGLILKTKGILQKIFEVETKDYWERDFRWDTTGDPRSFYVRIYVNKGIDSRSKIFTEVVFQGLQPTDPSKDGTLIIFIGAKLLTEFTFSTPIQKTFLYRGIVKMYNFAFYNRVRKGYIDLCNDWLTRLNREFRNNLNLPNAK